MPKKALNLINQFESNLIGCDFVCEQRLDGRADDGRGPGHGGSGGGEHLEDALQARERLRKGACCKENSLKGEILKAYTLYPQIKVKVFCDIVVFFGNYKGEISKAYTFYPQICKG